MVKKDIVDPIIREMHRTKPLSKDEKVARLKQDQAATSSPDIKAEIEREIEEVRTSD